MIKKPTVKEQAFIYAYTGEARYNATNAAIIAGYSENTARQTGYELLTKPYIQGFIESHQDYLANKNETTIAKIDKYHKDAFEIAKEKGNPSAMTQAAKNLGDLYGFNKNPQKINTNLSISAVIELPQQNVDD